MADYSIPLNRVGVIKASLLDISGQPTPKQIPTIWWMLGSGSSSYFTLVVAADGLSAEVHPVAVGSGSITIELNVSPTRQQNITIDITSNASDTGPSGNDPRFIGTQLSVVHNVGVSA